MNESAPSSDGLGLARPGTVFARAVGMVLALVVVVAAGSSIGQHVSIAEFVRRLVSSLWWPFGPLAAGAGTLAALVRWRFLQRLNLAMAAAHPSTLRGEREEVSGSFTFPQIDVRLAGRTTVMIATSANDGVGVSHVSMWVEAGLPSVAFGSLAGAVRSIRQWRPAGPTVVPCSYRVVRFGLPGSPEPETIVDLAILEHPPFHYVVRRSSAGRLYATRHASRELAEAQLRSESAS